MYADMILTGGTIYSADQEDNYYESIAIKDGRIIYTGDQTGVETYKGGSTQIIDCTGKMVLPGMVDCHLHPPGNLLFSMYDIYLSNCHSLDDIMDTIRTFVKEHPDADRYYGAGVDTGQFTGLEGVHGPRKERLDEICPDKPMIISTFDFHSCWANSKAFEEAGVTKDTPDPKGGRIEKDPETGELWGIMREKPAIELLKMQEFTPEQKKEALLAFQRELHEWGYTGIFSIPAQLDCTDGLKEMADEGILKLRVSGAYYLWPESMQPEGKTIAEQFEELEYQRSNWNEHPDVFQINTLKVACDGVVEGVTAGLLEPYVASGKIPENFYGKYIFEDKKEYEDVCIEGNRRGFPVHVHCIGDGAARRSLDAFAKSREQNGPANFRNTLTHLQLVAPEDIDRMKELDVIAAVQPYWMFKAPGMWQLETTNLGIERAEKEYPLGIFFEKGITVTGSSDYGVTPVPYPFIAIEVGVTRNITTADAYGVEDITDMDDPTYLLGKEQRASLENMIKAFTANAAYQCLREEDNGTITVGKYADLVVIDQDLFKINPVDIEKVKVLKTIFNGEIVYDGEAV